MRESNASNGRESSRPHPVAEAVASRVDVDGDMQTGTVRPSGGTAATDPSAWVTPNSLADELLQDIAGASAASGGPEGGGEDQPQIARDSGNSRFGVMQRLAARLQTALKQIPGGSDSISKQKQHPTPVPLAAGVTTEAATRALEGMQLLHRWGSEQEAAARAAQRKLVFAREHICAA